MFRMVRDEVLDADLLLSIIREHEIKVVDYMKLKNQYLTKPPILYKEEVADWKPDDRIPVNFGRYIVDTYAGFFNGNALRLTHPDEDVDSFIKEFWRFNNMDNVMSELAKITSIYGLGYLYIYQNEHAQTEVAYNDPMDMFVIYSDEIRPRALYAVRYTYGLDGVYRGQLFTDTEEYYFRLTNGNLNLEFTQNLYYGRVPIVEFIENEERMSLIEPVVPMINTYNRVISEKSNDVSYFSDAYMAVIGAILDDESMEQLKANRLINLAGEGSDNVRIEFLSKPNADSTQEHLLDRLENKIFETSMVVNLNDDSYGGAESSGVALARREQPMANMALNKEHKFTHSLQTLFSMLFRLTGTVPTDKVDSYTDILYLWKRNLPANHADEANTVEKLTGIVSKRKQLEMLSAVDDVDLELERLEDEELAKVNAEPVVSSKDTAPAGLTEQAADSQVIDVERQENIDKLNRLLSGV